MRIIKLLALAAITAVGLIASVAVAPAIAEPTALCEVDEGEICEVGFQISHIHYEAKNIKVLSTQFEIECKSLILGDAVVVTELLKSPMDFDVGFNAKTGLQDLAFVNCDPGCAVKQLEKFVLDFLRTEDEKATVKALELTLGFECDIPPLDCEYSAEALTGQALGPLITNDNGHITFSKAALTRVGESGPLCPEEAKFDALFIALPNPIYIKE